MADFYSPPSHELSQKRRALAPETEKAFQAFSQQVFASGALPANARAGNTNRGSMIVHFAQRLLVGGTRSVPDAERFPSFSIPQLSAFAPAAEDSA
jgi:hypothetical protein